MVQQWLEQNSLWGSDSGMWDRCQDRQCTGLLKNIQKVDEKSPGGGSSPPGLHRCSCVYQPAALREQRYPAEGRICWGGLPMWGGDAKTVVEKLQQHQVPDAFRFCWVSYFGKQKALWGGLLAWLAVWWALKAPISIDYCYLLRSCVWKADCGLSGSEDEGRGGWFLRGKLCAD